jgi:hypothetical protein
MTKQTTVGITAIDIKTASKLINKLVNGEDKKYPNKLIKGFIGELNDFKIYKPGEPLFKKQND